ncbi:MAG: pyridoxamine 5'-phosphate oxidase family protein [Clostridium sp.]|nr:pyridoxamine 5'-phosphate oxidase family protein [Clostridium sp.]
MFTEKFFEVLKHEGVVSIVSWGSGEPHINNTWNSYLVIKNNDKILLPAAGFNSTEADLKKNDKVLVTLGSKEVEGFNGYQGTGFRIEGTAKFISSGEDFDMMKEKFPFLTRVLEVTAKSSKQLL